MARNWAPGADRRKEEEEEEEIRIISVALPHFRSYNTEL